jgi:serine protease Do
MIRTFACLPVLALLAAAPGARAQNEPFRVTNRSAVPATELYVSRSGQPWNANLLARGPLAPGDFLALRTGDGGGCLLDIRLVLQGGQELVLREADVCKQRNIEMTGGPPPTPRIGGLPQVGGQDRLLPTINAAPR